MRKVIVRIARFIGSFRRPSKAGNIKLLEERGERLDQLIIREAVEADISKLSALHVRTWADTYPNVRKPPTFGIREWQWKEQFKETNDNWFCFVIENTKDELVAFAKGKIESPAKGNLNKIYVSFQYHRLGLGSRLMAAVAGRFLSRGVNYMTVHAEANNPSCKFYELMGGVHLHHPDGRINYGGYYWDDLEKLVALCAPKNN